MSGINKVILIGSLGADPDMKGDGGIANMSIATSENWKDKQSGEKKEQTEWHRVVAYKRTAEIAGQYLKKGSKVYIEGKLQTRKWQGQDGKDNYTTEIVVRDLQMLDSRPQEGGQNQGAFQGQQQQSPQQGQNQGGFQGGQQQPAPQQQGGQQQPAPQQQAPQQAPQQGQNQGGFQGGGQQQQAPQQQQGQQPAPQPKEPDFDDDIPF